MVRIKHLLRVFTPNIILILLQEDTKTVLGTRYTVVTAYP